MPPAARFLWVQARFAGRSLLLSAPRQWPRRMKYVLRHMYDMATVVRDGRLGRARRPQPELMTAVLLSFDRPWNMDALARVFLRSDVIGTVIVSNNNPAYRIDDLVRVRDERLVLIDQPRRTACGHRFEVARAHPNEWYVAADDDIFLRFDELRSLAARALSDPSFPCGIHGDVYDGPLDISSVRVTSRCDWPFRRAVPGRDAEADILNGVYVFSRRHLARYFEHSQRLGIPDQASFNEADDIVISHSGQGRARLVHPSKLRMCASSYVATISISGKEPERFYPRRWQIFASLRARGAQ